MNEYMQTKFLGQRLKLLREKNEITMDEMAKMLNRANKSSISRVEAGKMSFPATRKMAEEYCNKLQMSEEQTKQILRGGKTAIVDTKTLITRPDLLGKLCEEYSSVYLPSFVIDELKCIKDNNSNGHGLVPRAGDLLNAIDTYGIAVYSTPDVSEEGIIKMANALSDELSNEIDIITADEALASGINRTIKKDSKYNIMSLERYVKTKQPLINMKWLNAVNDYYADSYDDIEIELGMKMPEKQAKDWNCYLTNGNTLIISAVKNEEVPVKQRIEKIRWLISNGADVDMRDHENKNFPAITHAIKRHNYELFNFLLKECNANPNIGSRNPYDIGKVRQKNEGNTPLMVAAWENQIEMVRDLCNDERVSINQQDSNGFTALIKACYWRNLECAEIIEKRGADTTILDHEGMSADDRLNECIRIRRYKEKENGN